jgi:hypothetical protein
VKSDHAEREQEAEQCGTEQDGETLAPRVAGYREVVIGFHMQVAATTKRTPGGPAAEQTRQRRRAVLFRVPGPTAIGDLFGDLFDDLGRNRRSSRAASGPARRRRSANQRTRDGRRRLRWRGFGHLSLNRGSMHIAADHGAAGARIAGLGART